MKVTYLGTTVLLFDDGIDQILIDANVTRPPFLKAFFSKFQSDEKLVTKVITDFKIDRLKAIFISHTHLDHVLDLPTFSRICNADVYGSKSAINVALGGNIDINKCHCFDDSMSYTIGNYEIRVLKSIHSKAHWYNDDLGDEIEVPLVQPAKKGDFKEGGSFDFLIINNGKSYLVRPSYNYLKDELNDINADILYQGVAGITKDSKSELSLFFSETIDKVKPGSVIPIHWDNFFKPLGSDESYKYKWFLEQPDESFKVLNDYCRDNNINCIVQNPMTTLDF